MLLTGSADLLRGDTSIQLRGAGQVTSHLPRRGERFQTDISERSGGEVEGFIQRILIHMAFKPYLEKLCWNIPGKQLQKGTENIFTLNKHGFNGFKPLN